MENQSNSFSDATGRYAKSIFQLASEKNILNEVEKNFSQVLSLFKNSKDFQKFVVNPTIQKNVRFSIIESLSNKMGFNNYFINFLKLINGKGRFFYLEKNIRFIHFIKSIKSIKYIKTIRSGKKEVLHFSICEGRLGVKNVFP